MKKLFIYFFIFVFFAPNASHAISRAIPSSVSTEKADSMINVSSRDSVVSEKSDDAPARKTVSRTASGSVADKVSDATIIRSGARAINLDAPAQTTLSVRNDDATVSRSAMVSRSSMSGTDSAARTGLDAAVNTVGLNSRVDGASINNNPALRRAGLTLRPTTAEVGGRAKIAGTDIQTGSNIGSEIRTISSRAASVDAETIAQATERLEQTATLNKSCQEQYNDCMDQFCAVVDTNQKRCSCSANLKNYTEVEDAVTDANTQLNDVAQRIRYVGLSADEIRAILNETEAEAALSGQTDTSETRNMLEDIEKLIQDPIAATNYTSDFTTGLDIDLDFSATGGDMFNLDFLNTSSSGSFSNLRGTQLYNAAKNRCTTILNQCRDAGATSSQITGNYDLAIDKDCIAYEQGLKKMNETLASNVRSANLMLQKARLAVLQNKNMYDAKGCIGALDACMTDDMVCGSDYTKCLDPTKKYIDENGEVVLGQNITDIITFMEGYNNANVGETFLTNSYASTFNDIQCKQSLSENSSSTAAGTVGDGHCNVKYLLQKIGTKQDVTDEGLCRAVLDKCQAYTYDDDKKYQPYNDVVINYIQRAMVNIKAGQQSIISEYASSCMVDIASCYNQQVTQINAWSSAASVDSVYSVMKGACRNVALTCAYAVFAKDSDSCPVSSSDGDDTCIDSISKMFYQSLLCPDNSVYTDTSGTAGSDGYINERCQCLSGYRPYASSCVLCPSNSTYNDSTKDCDCASGYTMSANVCVANVVE